jgi:hypothetical protein
MAEPAQSLHPAASNHLPLFITAPGETDVLMVVVGIILLLAVMMFGILFLRLHTLPERMAHKSQKIQFEIVAVLGLIALFTHMHVFWIAALLLALIDLPDFGGSLGRIAESTERIAGIKSADGAAGSTQPLADGTTGSGAASALRAKHAAAADGSGVVVSTTAVAPPGRAKEPSHA